MPVLQTSHLAGFLLTVVDLQGIQCVLSMFSLLIIAFKISSQGRDNFRPFADFRTQFKSQHYLLLVLYCY